MKIDEQELKRVNQHKDSWFRRDGSTLYVHYFDGLDGNRCDINVPPFVDIRGAITWDSVTCPDCLKLKRQDEPWTVEIDTKGD